MYKENKRRFAIQETEITCSAEYMSGDSELYFDVTRPVRLVKLILEVDGNTPIINVKKERLDLHREVILRDDINKSNLIYSRKLLPISEENSSKNRKKYVFRIRNPKLFCRYRIKWDFLD